MDLTVVAQTDVGRVRTNNEDAYLVDADLGLFIVCDGMGGHNAGEVASRAACDVLAFEIGNMARVRERFLATGSLEDAETLRKAVEAAMVTACREIHRRSSKEPALTGMGTTCTLVLLGGHDKGILAHVGDSRLYVVRGGRLHQLSEDHTYVNELLRRGSLTREQARNHPQGNVLSRALGVQSSVNAETMVFDVDPGDTYLLCTDGLHNYFSEDTDLQTSLSDPELKHGLATVVKFALDRGGHDNVTGIALRIGSLQAAENRLPTADHRIGILKRLPLFAHLGYHDLARLVGLTQVARALPGQVIVREGDMGNELYVLVTGEADVEKDGRVVNTLKPGSYFAEMAVLESTPHLNTMRARTQADLVILRRAMFLELARNEPVVAARLLWNFSQVVASRQRDAGQAVQTPRR